MAFLWNEALELNAMKWTHVCLFLVLGSCSDGGPAGV